MEKPKYVDNDVFKFRCSLKSNIDYFDVTVFTKPFNNDTDYELPLIGRGENEKLVQKKYFTPERINELKLKLIQEIQECQNPFDIYCVDVDGGYNVTEDELFDLEKGE